MDYISHHILSVIKYTSCSCCQKRGTIGIQISFNVTSKQGQIIYSHLEQKRSQDGPLRNTTNKLPSMHNSPLKHEFAIYLKSVTVTPEISKLLELWSWVNYLFDVWKSFLLITSRRMYPCCVGPPVSRVARQFLRFKIAYLFPFNYLYLYNWCPSHRPSSMRPVTIPKTL